MYILIGIEIRFSDELPGAISLAQIDFATVVLDNSVLVGDYLLPDSGGPWSRAVVGVVVSGISHRTERRMTESLVES
jgi:hypothetical protein